MELFNEYWPIFGIVAAGVWGAYKTLNTYKEQQRKDIEINRISLVAQIKAEADERAKQIAELRAEISTMQEERSSLITYQNRMTDVLARRGMLAQVLLEMGIDDA